LHVEIYVKILFFICLGLIAYTYLIYPFLVILVSRFVPKRNPDFWDEYPCVTMVIAAYNEEAVLAEKIANCLSLTYPADRIRFLFGSDGSSDRTNQILGAIGHPQIQVRLFPERAGKSAVLNRLVEEVEDEILLFSDANSIYRPDAVEKLVRHFSDPLVGGVCGKLRLISTWRDPGGQAEGLYWQYENLIKQAEGVIRSVISANGSVFAIRRAFFQPLPTARPANDDLLLTFEVLKQGAVVRYEPQAQVEEVTSPCMGGEFTRKIRISSLNFNGLPEMAKLLSPRHGFTALALLSHKLIRWLVPFLAIGMLISNLLLIGRGDLYSYTLMGQILVYLGALIGYLGDRWLGRSGPFLPFYYLAMINLALLIGLWRSLSGSQTTAWKRVAHQQDNN